MESNRHLSSEELSTILAALRFWQRSAKPRDRKTFPHFADCEPLTDEQIDDLCEYLNTP